MMSNYYSEQENKALEFAKLSGLPFIYLYTGGGCDAIYGETAKHRIYITSDASVPNFDEIYSVGVYSIADDDLVGEIYPNNRADLLATIEDLEIDSLDMFVEFILECGKFTPIQLGGE